MRELIQNSLDAGAARINVRMAWSDGELRIEVDDDGEGMDRATIEGYLLTLFRSTKEEDLTKIGKFGVGFVSVFGRHRSAHGSMSSARRRRWVLTGTAGEILARVPPIADDDHDAEQAIAAAVKAELEAWGVTSVAAWAIDEAIEAWSSGAPAGWPSIGEVAPEGPWVALLAFNLATAAAGAQQLELVARLAERLAERLGAATP